MDHVGAKSSQIKANEYFYSVKQTLHFSVSLYAHLFISFTKTIHQSPSGFFPPFWTIAKMCLWVPFLGTGRNATITLRVYSFFFHLFSFTKESAVKRCVSRLRCRDRSQNKFWGDAKTKWEGFGTHCLWIALLWEERAARRLELLALLRAWRDLGARWDDKMIPAVTFQLFAFFSSTWCHHPNCTCHPPMTGLVKRWRAWISVFIPSSSSGQEN